MITVFFTLATIAFFVTIAANVAESISGTRSFA